MVLLQFVLKGWVVWAGLLTLALGLLFGLREPMPRGIVPIGLGVLALVACMIGRLLLATHLRNTNRPGTSEIPTGVSQKISL
jgi:uncharacterized membrane protein